MAKHAVTLIPGDGTGPDVTRAARIVIDAVDAGIEWEVVEAGEAVIDQCGTPLPDYVLDSIRRNRVALKGPLTTPIGKGFRSVNVALRKELDLYANVRPAKSLPGVKTRYEGVDILLVRENTEDLYAGVEHMVGRDAAESIKIITRFGSSRIVRFAFDLARREGRHKVAAVHKANIMKCTDGLFLDVAREIAGEYPDIAFEDRIVDACCMKLRSEPRGLRRPGAAQPIRGYRLRPLRRSDRWSWRGPRRQHRRSVRRLRACPRERSQVHRNGQGQSPGHHPVRCHDAQAPGRA